MDFSNNTLYCNMKELNIINFLQKTSLDVILTLEQLSKNTRTGNLDGLLLSLNQSDEWELVDKSNSVELLYQSKKQPSNVFIKLTLSRAKKVSEVFIIVMGKNNIGLSLSLNRERKENTLQNNILYINILDIDTLINIYQQVEESRNTLIEQIKTYGDPQTVVDALKYKYTIINKGDYSILFAVDKNVILFLQYKNDKFDVAE